MSAMFDDYDEFMRMLRKAAPLTEERAQLLAVEVVTGLRGEEREVILAVLIELVYGMMPEPLDGAQQAELDQWKRHLGIVEAIARLADFGEEFEQKGRIDLLRRRRERAAAFRPANDPLPSPAPVEQDDEPTVAEMTGARYGQSDYEGWLAPMVHYLATPEPEMEVSRADELMKLLYVLESGNRVERAIAYGVAMTHAYNFTSMGQRQQAYYVARLVSQGREERKQEFDRLKMQEQIMAKLMMDTTPDAVIRATHEALEAQLQLSQ